jgi:chitin synthase
MTLGLVLKAVRLGCCQSSRLSASQLPCRELATSHSLQKLCGGRTKQCCRFSSNLSVTDEEEGAVAGIKCRAGDFRAAIDNLLDIMDDTQAWYIPCINPNDTQLPDQLEGRGVKGQVRSIGIPEMAQRFATLFGRCRQTSSSSATEIR